MFRIVADRNLVAAVANVFLNRLVRIKRVTQLIEIGDLQIGAETNAAAGRVSDPQAATSRASFCRHRSDR